jgi:tetratricopeptide (TPR) repeat protein
MSSLRSLFLLLAFQLLLPAPSIARDGVSLPQWAAANQDTLGTDAAKPAATEGAETPSVGLTSDMLYSVLVGEVARQRGDHRIAFTHLLLAAQLTRDPGLAEQAAREALVLNEVEAISRAIDVWLEIAPDSMTAQQIAAYVRLEANDVSGAMGHLRRLIDLASQEGENGFLRAARLVHKLRPPERRLELMKTLTDDEPENADAWFARALVAAGAERFEDAAKASRRAADLRPGWNEPRIFLVQVLQDQGKEEEAHATLEGFVAEMPDDQGLRLLYAQMLVDEKEFSRARDVFEFMLHDAPKEPDVLFALGILSLQLDDLDAARGYFTRLNETGERTEDAVYYLGQVEELAENLDQAASWYAKVEGDHALDASVRVARIEARRGGVDQARERLQQLRDQSPDQAVLIYLAEAEILADLGRNREAMTVYDAAVEANPDNTQLLYARALYAVGLDRMDILERDLRAILAKDPDHADALNALGYSLADRTDRSAEALALIERALALKPDDPAVLDSMGWVHFRLGNLAQAERYLRRAVDKLPDGEIAAHLGEVLWAIGKKDEAWKVWEGALALDPDHEYLLRTIGRHRITRNDKLPASPADGE